MKKLALSFTALLLLSSCSSKQYPAVQKDLDAGEARLDKEAKTAAPKPAEHARVTHSDIPKFGMESYVVHEFTLPRELAGKKLVVKDTMTLQQIATFLSSKGIPTRVGEQLENTQAAAAPAQPVAQARAVPLPFSSNPQATSTALTTDDQALLTSLGVNNPQILGGAPLPLTFTVDFTGDANEFIHKVEDFFGVAASMQEGVLRFNYYQIRTFHVNAPSSSAKTISGFTANSAGASVSGGGSGSGGNNGGSGASGGSTSVTQTLNEDIWPEINDQLHEMLPAKSSRYKVSAGLGTVLVVASPVVMSQVERYFDELNATLDPRIAIDVTLIKFNLTNAANFDFDLNVLLSQVSHGAQAVLGGMAPSIVGATGTGGVQIVSASSQANTSLALLRAIASTSRLVDVKTGSTVTQNNRPASFKLMTNQDIIKSIQLNVYGGTSNVASTTVTPATLTYGYSMTVWPKVIGHNRISISMSSMDSNLTALTTVTYSGNQLQEATTTDGQINNEITLGQGETLVLSGFDQDTVSKQTSGVGEDTNMALGGTNDVSHSKTRQILIVTPKLLKSPDAGPTSAAR